MFAVERINIIKNYLRERGKLDVHSISEMLGVSEVTVRRDLEKLEAEGFLTRMHGGAMLREDAPAQADSPALTEDEKREETNREEIARIAILMIEDGDVIMLVNGPIARLVAAMLSERDNVTVLTNDIDVAIEVSGQAGNRAVLLGGSPDPESRAVFGNVAQANLQKFFVSKLFLEADGVSEQLQLTVSSQEKAALIKEAIACAEGKVVLCESSRFGRNAFFRLGPISLATKVITDTNAPAAFKSKAFEMDIQLFTSVNAFEGRIV
jgi:DeoR/GlpR family transcriptional regulator of sugar metabolism